MVLFLIATTFFNLRPTTTQIRLVILKPEDLLQDIQCILESLLYSGNIRNKLLHPK